MTHPNPITYESQLRNEINRLEAEKKELLEALEAIVSGCPIITVYPTLIGKAMKAISKAKGGA